MTWVMLKLSVAQIFLRSLKIGLLEANMQSISSYLSAHYDPHRKKKGEEDNGGG